MAVYLKDELGAIALALAIEVLLFNDFNITVIGITTEAYSLSLNLLAKDHRKLFIKSSYYEYRVS